MLKPKPNYIFAELKELAAEKNWSEVFNFLESQQFDFDQFSKEFFVSNSRIKGFEKYFI